jgi:hypothetical protein
MLLNIYKNTITTGRNAELNTLVNFQSNNGMNETSWKLLQTGMTGINKIEKYEAYFLPTKIMGVFLNVMNVGLLQVRLSFFSARHTHKCMLMYMLS